MGCTQRTATLKRTEPPLDQSAAAFFDLRCRNCLAFPPGLGFAEPTMDRLDFKFVDNLRPPCSKCGRPLILTRIEPGKPDFDLRTYYCAACQDTEVIIAAIHSG
jgi:hypothetical protein